MGIGTSIFLIAAGAILNYGVDTKVSGLNIHTIGVILMVVGAIGLIISLLYTLVWADRTRGTAVVDGVPRERTVVRDREVL